MLCGICGASTVTLIWIMQNYLQLLLCLVVLIIAIHYCMVSPTLTSLHFNVFRIDWSAICNVARLCSLQWLPVRFRILFQISCWATTCVIKISLLIFTPCFLHHYHPIHWDRTKVLVCQSLRSRPTRTQELFTVVARLFGTTSRCLSIQPFQLLPSRNIWRHISLTWPFPNRHWHARWPVDVTELFL